MPRRSLLLRVVALLAVIGVTGCTLPPLATPTPSPTPSPTPTPTPSPTATPSPTPTPEPTPDAAAMPDFGAGEIVTTAIDGLRVRQRPGFGSSVVAGLVPLGAELEVVMGPVLIEEMGWYLVAYADADEPAFEQGWIASGFEPEAFLLSSGRIAEETPYVASFAQTGDAEYGPIEIPDEHHAVRWLAVDPERVRCQFSVLMAAGGGAPVPAIRATVGNDVVPGTLQPSFFAGQPDLRGQVFLTIATDCAWTLVVVRVPDPGASPSPSAAAP
jgi:hypothetical protein